LRHRAGIGNVAAQQPDARTGEERWQTLVRAPPATLSPSAGIRATVAGR
jgi:hypothetical protein